MLKLYYYRDLSSDQLREEYDILAYLANDAVLSLGEKVARLTAELTEARENEVRWRDVAHELPKEAQEVLIVRNGKTVHGAWIGGIFWYSNRKVVAAYWMPLPNAIVGSTLDAARSAGDEG